MGISCVFCKSAASGIDKGKARSRVQYESIVRIVGRVKEVSSGWKQQQPKIMELVVALQQQSGAYRVRCEAGRPETQLDATTANEVEPEPSCCCTSAGFIGGLIHSGSYSFVRRPELP